MKKIKINLSTLQLDASRRHVSADHITPYNHSTAGRSFIIPKLCYKDGGASRRNAANNSTSACVGLCSSQKVS